MTEYEYASLFVEFLAAANAVFANYLALTFGMFTASYLVAQKMTKSMTVLFLGLYTTWALFMLTGVVAAFGDFAHLGVAIAELGLQRDTSLGWLGPVRDMGQGNSMAAMPAIIGVFGVMGYLASIVFFFVVRSSKNPIGLGQ